MGSSQGKSDFPYNRTRLLFNTLKCILKTLINIFANKYVDSASIKVKNLKMIMTESRCTKDIYIV